MVSLSVWCSATRVTMSPSLWATFEELFESQVFAFWVESSEIANEERCECLCDRVAVRRARETFVASQAFDPNRSDAQIRQLLANLSAT